jgi:hypothetical protein
MLKSTALAIVLFGLALGLAGCGGSGSAEQRLLTSQDVRREFAAAHIELTAWPAGGDLYEGDPILLQGTTPSVLVAVYKTVLLAETAGQLLASPGGGASIQMDAGGEIRVVPAPRRIRNVVVAFNPSTGGAHRVRAAIAGLVRDLRS